MRARAWKAIATIGFAASAGVVIACSGTTLGGGGQYDSCLGSIVGSECVSCVRSNCSSALDGLESSCGDGLACICPGGTFSASAEQSQTCGQKFQESGCQSWSQMNTGICQPCSHVCAGSSSGSSNGGPSSGGSGGPGSSSGGTSSGSSSGGGACTQCGPVCVAAECGGCGAAPTATAMRSISLVLTGVSFDGGTNGLSPTIGLNLDGDCTTAVSTDVCWLPGGASKATQVDGPGGIDNSFGASICPIFDTLVSGFCSFPSLQVYVTTDATGSGTLAIGLGGSAWEFPIYDAYVASSGSAGVLAAVAPTTGVVGGFKAVAGHISSALCSGTALDAIAMQIEQVSDIMSNGSNAPGKACDSISIGVTFTGSSPFNGVFPPVSDHCGSDASAD